MEFEENVSPPTETATEAIVAANGAIEEAATTTMAETAPADSGNEIPQWLLGWDGFQDAISSAQFDNLNIPSTNNDDLGDILPTLGINASVEVAATQMKQESTPEKEDMDKASVQTAHGYDHQTISLEDFDPNSLWWITFQEAIEEENTRKASQQQQQQQQQQREQPEVIEIIEIDDQQPVAPIVIEDDPYTQDIITIDDNIITIDDDIITIDDDETDAMEVIELD
jgi:hypothetical protein